MKYIVLKDWDVDRLAREISEKFEDGWVLQGGASMFFDEATGCNTYVQAMIKKER